jgi:hypothetical protein
MERLLLLEKRDRTLDYYPPGGSSGGVVGSGRSTNDFEEFVGRLQSARAGYSFRASGINFDGGHGQRLDLEACPAFSVGNIKRSNRLELANAQIRTLHVDSSENVSITKSRIGVLEVNISNAVRNLGISNCNIGRLELTGTGQHSDILISDTHISELQISSNFSAKEVWLDRVTFEVDRLIATRADNLKQIEDGDLPRLNRSSFAHLYDWAERQGNSEVAHLARGRELALQKAHAKGAESVVLTLWGVFSDFGNSFWRPLKWIGFLIPMFSLVLWSTGTDAGFACSSDCGWRENLIGEDASAQLLRGVVGALEGIFSPFSVFSQRSLVIPISPWVAGLKIAYSYLCLGLVFLFGFAVRRRFKMH